MDQSNPQPTEHLEVPTTTWLRQIAREEARTEITHHMTLCQFAADRIAERTRSLEVKLATLLGFMAGSGLLGGITGAALIKALSP